MLGRLWRFTFFGSALLVVVGPIAGTRPRETPSFVQLEERDDVAHHPLREVRRSWWRTILVGTGLRMEENGGSHLLQTLTITFITT